MKKYYFIIFMFFTTFSILLASDGTQYSNLYVESNSDNVVLKWETTDEDNLRETCIERKTVNGVFSEIGKVAAKGDNSSYMFVDENAFKIEGGIYLYRLKFVYSDNKAPGYSAELSVTHLTSVGKQTWGSIKALFR